MFILDAWMVENQSCLIKAEHFQKGMQAYGDAGMKYACTVKDVGLTCSLFGTTGFPMTLSFTIGRAQG